MVSLIDADAIIYIIAFSPNFKEGYSEKEIIESADSIVTMILHNTNATGYIGVLSPSTNFRYREYNVAPYKGQRLAKDERFQDIERIVKLRLSDKWKFYMAIDMEADDAVCAFAELYKSHAIEYTVCSPDKDMRQIPGKHYDYKKNEHLEVSDDQAFYNLCVQLLMGDKTDNILGLPGIGEVKARKILDANDSSMTYLMSVKTSYVKAFGETLGPNVYHQTMVAVRLLCIAHPLYNNYVEVLKQDIADRYIEFDAAELNHKDIKLDALGW